MKNFKHTILKSIEIIYECSKESGLEDSLFKKIDSELSLLCEYFKTTKRQSFLIAVIFSLNYKGDYVDYKDLIEFFNCNPVKLLYFADDFNYLKRKKFFNRHMSSHRVDVTGANDQYSINKKVSKAILRNDKIPVINEAVEDILGLLEKLYEISVQRENHQIETSALFAEGEKLILSYARFPLIKKIRSFNFKICDEYLLIYIIWISLSGNSGVDANEAINAIYDNAVDRIFCLRKLLSGENDLIKNGFVEVSGGGFFSNAELVLSDASKKILGECGLALSVKKRSNVLQPSDIREKELIFNSNEMGQIGILKKLFKGQGLAKTRNRLQTKGLPSGITVLMHGPPGTGKTESALQLARESGREIMKIDISSSKSKWYGESEKIIKGIFTDYKLFSQVCTRTPILLFNEADAIISTRYSLADSSCDQTHNAIQNIILEELENFEGILFATTNFADSLDPAFERRFLFKILFNKPDVSTKSKIWKLKFPELSAENCRAMAGEFDFSGGQIDNIYRKKEIKEIIDGRPVKFERILDFCRQEKIDNKDDKRMGFL